MTRIWVALLAAMLALAGCTSEPQDDTTTTDDGDGATDPNGQADGGEAPGEEETAFARIMAKADEVAAALDTPEEALAAGYQPAPECVPGMGVHWAHKPGSPDSHFDAKFDPDFPEVLLFEPQTPDPLDAQNQTFLGIEYVVVTEGTDMNTTETVPVYEGVRFVGPMAGHFPGMPWHAELHLYLADDVRSDDSFPEMRESITCPAPEDEGEDAHAHEHEEHDDSGGETGAERAPATDAAYARIMAKADEVAATLNTTEKAWDAGYRPTPVCVPGMGVHWIHKPGQNDSHFDVTFDPDFPEVVLFQPDTANLSDTANDTFLGIEYVVVTEGTDMNTTETVPVYEGVRFYGPMPGHSPNEPWHAELHVYLAEDVRSDASFPEFRDAITCPESDAGDGDGESQAETES